MSLTILALCSLPFAQFLQKPANELAALAVAECACPNVQLLRVLELPSRAKRNAPAVSAAETGKGEYYVTDGGPTGATLIRFSDEDANSKGKIVQFQGLAPSRTFPILKATRTGVLYAVGNTRNVQRVNTQTREVTSVAVGVPPWDYLPGSSYIVVNLESGDPESAGWPLHLLDWSGERIRSFGAQEAEYNAYRPNNAVRRLAGSIEQGLFAATLDGVITGYDPAGNVLGTWPLPRPSDTKPRDRNLSSLMRRSEVNY